MAQSSGPRGGYWHGKRQDSLADSRILGASAESCNHDIHAVSIAHSRVAYAFASSLFVFSQKPRKKMTMMAAAAMAG